MRLKKILNCFVAIGAMALLLISCNSGVTKDTQIELKNAISQVPMIYTVEAVAQIFVDNKDTQESLKSYFGDRVIVVPLKANIKAGVNLSKLDSLYFKDGVAHVVLPDPEIEIESTEIAYEDMIFNVSGMRDRFSEEEITALASAGRQKIVENLYKMDLIEPATKQAEAILQGIAARLGTRIVFDPKPQTEKLNIENLVKK